MVPTLVTPPKAKLLVVLDTPLYEEMYKRVEDDVDDLEVDDDDCWCCVERGDNAVAMPAVSKAAAAVSKETLLVKVMAAVVVVDSITDIECQ
jgi:hypothetical protein